MAGRTGIPTLIKVARELCRLILLFGPIITRLYPDNSSLLVAMAAAQAACHTFHDELEKVKEIGV